MPNHYGGDLLHTMGISGLSRVRTELLHLSIVPAAPPHPVQLDGQLAGHRYFRDFAPPPHSEVKKLAAPLRVAAHRDLRRFHQQEAQQHVALLADVAESASVAAGLLAGSQPHVAGDLLGAGKTFRRPNH